MSKAFFTKSLLLDNKILVRRLKSLVIHAQPPAPATERAPHRRATTTTVTPCTAPLDELPAPAPRGGGGAVAVCKVEGGLLMSSSTFPYFMLVALEAGGLLRGLVLLLLYPFLRLLSHDCALKVMVMVSFLGLRKDGFRLGRAVMPKLFLEDVSAKVFQAAVAPRRRRRCVCVSAMPRAMVEPFLKEYLDVDAVVAPELREFRGYYLGLMEHEGEVLQKLDMEKVIGANGGGDGVVVGIGGLGCSFHQFFQKYCKVSSSHEFTLHEFFRACMRMHVMQSSTPSAS